MTEDDYLLRAAKPGIPMSELKVRGVYSLVARNLTCGVWDGQTFTGIREKFGRLRLAGEYPFDHEYQGHATAKPIELLGMLPDIIELHPDGPRVDDRRLFRYLYNLPDNADLRGFLTKDES
jgi:hypothetical protein